MASLPRHPSQPERGGVSPKGKEGRRPGLTQLVSTRSSISFAHRTPQSFTVWLQWRKKQEGWNETILILNEEVADNGHTSGVKGVWGARLSDKKNRSPGCEIDLAAYPTSAPLPTCMLPTPQPNCIVILVSSRFSVHITTVMEMLSTAGPCCKL